MPFDPDKYLAEQEDVTKQEQGGFDPDAYLATAQVADQSPDIPSPAPAEAPVAPPSQEVIPAPSRGYTGSFEAEKPKPRNRTDAILGTAGEVAKGKGSAMKALGNPMDARYWGDRLVEAGRSVIKAGGDVLGLAGGAMQLAAVRTPEHIAQEREIGALMYDPTGFRDPDFLGRVKVTEDDKKQSLIANTNSELMKFGAEVRRVAADISDEFGSEYFQKEFEWTDLADPQFYTTKGVATLTQMAPVLALTYASGGTASSFVASAGVKGMPATVIPAVAAGLASRPLESAMEAVGVFNDMIDSGATPEQASQAASKTFNKNLGLSVLDMAEYALAFGKVPKGMREGLAKYISRAIGIGVAGGAEGYEELLQGYISDQAKATALGEPDVDFIESLSLATPEQREQFAMGVLMGTGFQMSGIMSKQELDNVIEEIQSELPTEGGEMTAEAEAQTGQELQQKQPEVQQEQELSAQQELEFGVEQPIDIEQQDGAVTEEATAEDAGEDVGIKNDAMDKLREERGLEVVEGSGGRFGEDIRASAREKGLVEQAEQIADRIIASQGESVIEGLATDEEQYAIGEKIARLDDEYLRIVETTENVDDIAPAFRERMDAITEEIDYLSTALKRTGTNLSTAFKARQLAIKRNTYELSEVVKRAEKLAGKEITKDMKGQLEKLTIELKKAQAKLKKFEDGETDIDDINIQKAVVRKSKRDIDTVISTAREKNAKYFVNEYLNFFRPLMATADMSYVFRQAFIPSMSHPILAGRAFKGAGKAMFSEKAYDKIMAEIESDPSYKAMKKYGLRISDISDMAEGEELFAGTVMKKIWGAKTVLNASERHMTAGLNILRTELFKDFVKKHPKVSPEVLEAYTKYINAATGYGNMNPTIAKGLSSLMFAPKFAYSRIEAPARAVSLLKNKETRGEIARQWGALAGTAFTVIALAKSAGLDVDDDPSSPDFGKIVIGDSSIDMFAGMQQPFRVLGRGAKAIARRGTIDDKYTDDLIEAAADFLKYKSNPSITLPFEIAGGRDVLGRELGKDSEIVGVDVPRQLDIISEAVGSKLVPLSMQQLYELASDRKVSPEEALALYALESLGISVQTYERGKGKKRQF